MRNFCGILVVAAVLTCAVGSVAKADGEIDSGLADLDFRQVVKRMTKGRVVRITLQAPPAKAE